MTYGHPPDPAMPWPMFVLALGEGSRRSARALLTEMQGTVWGVRTALAEMFGKGKPTALYAQLEGVRKQG